MNRKAFTSIISASVVAFSGYSSAKADPITGTTYVYTSNAPTEPGNNFVFPDDAQAMNEYGLVGTNFGVGTLNDGLLGDQAYFNTQPAREDGYTGNYPAYQASGSIGQAAVGMPTNTADQTFGQSVYFSGSVAMSFNLGSNYTNLGTVDVNWVLDGTGAPPGTLTISDGVHPDVVGTFGDHGATPTTPNAFGNYLTDSFDISSLSGSNLTLSFDAPQGSFQAFEEITFNTAPVPEPTSLSLLGLGSVALLRRRSRRA